jgi:hypothetical protein
MVGYWRGSVACDVRGKLYLVAAILLMEIFKSERKLPCAVKGVLTAVVASKLPTNYFDDSKHANFEVVPALLQVTCPSFGPKPQSVHPTCRTDSVQQIRKLDKGQRYIVVMHCIL